MGGSTYKSYLANAEKTGNYAPPENIANRVSPTTPLSSMGSMSRDEQFITRTALLHGWRPGQSSSTGQESPPSNSGSGSGSSSSTSTGAGSNPGPVNIYKPSLVDNKRRTLMAETVRRKSLLGV